MATGYIRDQLTRSADLPGPLCPGTTRHLRKKIAFRACRGPVYDPGSGFETELVVVRRKLNLPVWPATGMAQTGRQTHRYGIFRVCAVWLGLVAAFWGAPRPKGQQLNPPIWRKPGKSHIGGSGDRFKPYRWSAIWVGLVSAESAALASVCSRIVLALTFRVWPKQLVRIFGFPAIFAASCSASIPRTTSCVTSRCPTSRPSLTKCVALGMPLRPRLTALRR